MSTVYNTAPPTKGKVVIKTSLGDLDVELWPKESPLAVRNFVQLCLEGYYDGTKFHRLIKGFILQGGDPTGSGTGGESIYGHPFKDEFHSRLHFQYRGILACANENAPHTNGSQFFITLDRTEGLEKKNTIFGKITGDSIYNLLRLAEVEVDDDDRPLHPPHIIETEVLWNPFEDIVPRSTREDRQAADEERRAIAASKQRAADKAAAAGGKKKNLALLSFGEEEEEEGAQQPASRGGGGASGGGVKIRSAHDVLEDVRLAREEETPLEERLASRRPAPSVLSAADEAKAEALADARATMQRATAEGIKSRAGADEDDEDATDGAPSTSRGGTGDFAGAMHARAIERRQRLGAGGGAAPDDGPVSSGRAHREADGGRDEEDEEAGGRGEGGGKEEGEGLAARRRRREELQAMRADPGIRTYGRVKTSDEVADADLLKPWQLSREKYKQKKRLLGDREKDTLAKLARFSDALRAPLPKVEPDSRLAAAAGVGDDQRIDTADADTAVKTEDGGAGYAGKVDAAIDHRTYLPAAWRVEEYYEQAAEGDPLSDLRGHTLQFVKDTRQRAMDRRDDVDDYVVFDPLLEKGKGKFSKLNQKGKKLETEWGKGKAGGTKRD